MPTNPNLSGLMPGFDALQGLMKNAGAALPGFGQWLTPTLDPQELGKRIEELKTVQFWLEQNARMIATTVQALEVQRMTLTTLKTLNVQVGDLAEAFRIRPAQAPEPAPSPAPAAAAREAAREAAPPASAPAAPGLVDPMQWWGALTQQFTTLASQSLADRSVGDAAAQMADAMMKGSAEVMDKALQPLAAAVAAAPTAAQRSAKPAASAAAGRPAAPAAAGRPGTSGAPAKPAKKPGAGASTPATPARASKAAGSVAARASAGRAAAKPSVPARKRAASR
jgi:hypothetical protein